jgi:hypothetical protein
MKKIFLIRLCICIGLLTSWICFRIYYLKEQTYNWNNEYSYKDILLDSIYDYSIKISQNLGIRDYLLIICSTGLDFFLVLFLFVYLIKGSNLRPIKNIIYFYIGRFMFNVKYADENILRLYSYPGFPSIIMNYDNFHERYISSYVGLMIIFMLNFYDFGYFKIFYFSFVFTLFLIMNLLLFRANLSVDIILGVILAHLTYLISEPKKIETKPKKVVITRRISKPDSRRSDVRIDVTKDNNDIFVMNYDE